MNKKEREIAKIILDKITLEAKTIALGRNFIPSRGIEIIVLISPIWSSKVSKYLLNSDGIINKMNCTTHTCNFVEHWNNQEIKVYAKDCAIRGEKPKTIKL